MELTALHILCLVSAFTLTTQELATLSVSPKITAECGQQVTLQCNVSSSLHGLSVKHMEWSHGNTRLCSVNGEGNVSYGGDAFGDFYCEYEEGRLSLVFPTMQPELKSRHYGCKLRSNKGAAHEYTAVELEECAGTVHGVGTKDGPSCTFNHVHPDGDVHWFLGSERLSAPHHHHNTSKRVEEGGRLTIHSHLQWYGPDGPFNCSLRSTKSGRYIASALIQVDGRTASTHGALGSYKNGVGAQGSTTPLMLCASALFAVRLF